MNTQGSNSSQRKPSTVTDTHRTPTPHLNATRAPSTRAQRISKPLPSRPISTIKDYMPPSSSRSSWRGLSFPHFAQTVSKGENRLQQLAIEEYLVARMEEINEERIKLGVKPWVVPKDVGMMKHVYKVWYGHDVDVPREKELGMEMELLDPNRVPAGVPSETGWTRGWRGSGLLIGDDEDEDEDVHAEKKPKPSVWVEIWINLKGLFRVLNLKRRNRNGHENCNIRCKL